MALVPEGVLDPHEALAAPAAAVPAGASRAGEHPLSSAARAGDLYGAFAAVGSDGHLAAASVVGAPEHAAGSPDPREKRKQANAALQRQKRQKKNHVQVQFVGGVEVDRKRLVSVVGSLGGFAVIRKKRLWDKVRGMLGYPDGDDSFRQRLNRALSKLAQPSLPAAPPAAPPAPVCAHSKDAITNIDTLAASAEAGNRE